MSIEEARTPMQFFQEANGDFSCMRLMALAALAAAIIFGGITLLVPKAAGVGVAITGMFLASSVGGKVAQKVFEEKMPPAP
jgi:hypothetical protein